MYDCLIVGAGLYGSILAYRARMAGMRPLVIEKRPHVGGNMYCEDVEGIQVHKYGPHIFHTSNKKVWDFVNSLVPFRSFRYCPLAFYKGRFYHLPFNMNTFYELWGTMTPDEAKEKIEEERKEIKGVPSNLEEQAISLVGRDVYEKLVKCYTEKQWGRDCKDLPPFIIKRLPVRFRFDNNYYDDCYQGIPEGGGYNALFDALLEGVEVRTGVNYFDNRDYYNSLAKKIIYCGPIDEFFDYRFGPLEYRSLRFEEEVLDKESFQGNVAVNYTDHDHPLTRIIEHKYFGPADQPKTVITREFPQEWKPGLEPFYPVNDKKNNEKYQNYKALADSLENVSFRGRLAEYKYYDMHTVVELALDAEL